MVLKPNILIISNLHDYSTDHVIYQLEKSNAKYLRLNRDQFSEYELTLDPINERIYGKTKRIEFEINRDTLKSIYYRAPIYLRNYPKENQKLEENISRDQWVSFIRNLLIFEDILWINNPKSTFLSENKPYQLKVAKDLGFKTPQTIISNNIPKTDFANNIAIKTLEPCIYRINDKQTFIYTTLHKIKDLDKYDLSNIPIIIQEALIPKIDVRVTVIDKAVYAVSITKNNKGINEDWRIHKEDLEYNLINLPIDIENKCINLLKKLNLKFGCIDLIKHEDDYYFLEINPTGEWDWLMYNLELDIDIKISELLKGSIQ